MKKRIIAELVVLVILIGITALVYWPPEEIPEVPLGVEHAVTIAYNGPELAIRPFKRGVAVNLRIANVIKKGDFRTYDIRYLVNRPGVFDINEYLESADGSPLPNMPSFKVKGITTLSETVDNRIEQVEALGIHIPHDYYKHMKIVAAVWVLWLLLVIFWPRKHVHVEYAAPTTVETFYDILRRFLEQLKSGALDNADKRELEILLFNWWRDGLSMHQDEMYRVITVLDSDPAISPAYRILESWLHDPKANVSTSELVESLEPFTIQKPDIPETSEMKPDTQ